MADEVVNKISEQEAAYLAARMKERSAEEYRRISDHREKEKAKKRKANKDRKEEDKKHRKHKKHKKDKSDKDHKRKDSKEKDSQESKEKGSQDQTKDSEPGSEKSKEGKAEEHKEERKPPKERHVKKPVDGPFATPHWVEELSEEIKKYIQFEIYKQEGMILGRQALGEKTVHVIGRDKHSSDIGLDHPSISRMHAVLLHTKEGLRVADLFSSHGTFVNEQRLTEGDAVVLYENDVLRFGGSSRCYCLKGSKNKRPAWLSSAVKSATLGNAVESKSSADAPAASGDAPVTSGDAPAKSASVAPPSSAPPAASSKKSNGSSKDKSTGKVRCSHILVKHKDSRRPSSHREAKITRTQAEATKILQGYRDQVMNSPGKFEEIAREFSDCASAKRGGDLGPFGPGQMQKPFEEAAFALSVGQISDIVSTESGVHIILRIE